MDNKCQQFAETTHSQVSGLFCLKFANRWHSVCYVSCLTEKRKKILKLRYIISWTDLLTKTCEWCASTMFCSQAQLSVSKVTGYELNNQGSVLYLCCYTQWQSLINTARVWNWVVASLKCRSLEYVEMCFDAYCTPLWLAQIRRIWHFCICFYIAVLLCSMHNLGKMGQNNFSAVQKLADLSSFTQSSNIHEHPAFGFKSCLVQMLGNLCWRHPENQNQVSCCWLISSIWRRKVCNLKSAPCHCSMAHSQVADRGVRFKLWRIALNIWIRSRHPTRGGSSAWGSGLC